MTKSQINSKLAEVRQWRQERKLNAPPPHLLQGHIDALKYLNRREDELLKLLKDQSK